MVTLWLVSAAVLDEMIFMEAGGQGRGPGGGGRLKRGEGRVRPGRGPSHMLGSTEEREGRKGRI